MKFLSEPTSGEREQERKGRERKEEKPGGVNLVDDTGHHKEDTHITHHDLYVACLS